MIAPHIHLLFLTQSTADPVQGSFLICCRSLHDNLQYSHFQIVSTTCFTKVRRLALVKAVVSDTALSVTILLLAAYKKGFIGSDLVNKHYIFMNKASCFA